MADSFTVFVEGVDLLSDDVQDVLERRFEEYDALFGCEDGARFAVFDCDGDDHDVAVERAVRRLAEALPELRVTAIQPGRHGSIDIR